MITRIKDKDNDLHWTITPRYKIGQVISYLTDATGERFAEVVGMSIDISRLREEARYCLNDGNIISEDKIGGTLTRDNRGEDDANKKQQRLV